MKLLVGKGLCDLMYDALSSKSVDLSSQWQIIQMKTSACTRDLIPSTVMEGMWGSRIQFDFVIS